MHITTFKSVKNSTPLSYTTVKRGSFLREMHELSWRSFLKNYIRKEQIPLFGFYKLKPNTTRSNENVEEISCIVLDCDNDNSATKYEDLEIPFNHFYYTTFSHTTKKPKFRIIVPLDEPCAPEDYEAAYYGAFRLMGEPAGFDHSACSVHRAYYLPANPKNGTFETAIVTEEYDAVLAELIAEGVDYVPAEPEKTQPVGRNQKYARIAGGMLSRGCNESEIVDELLSLDKQRKDPLFSDKSERFGGKAYSEPRINALNFVLSIISTRAKKEPEALDNITHEKTVPTRTGITPTPDALCLSAPGVCGALVRSILDYGITTPAYALGGALTIMSMIKGRSVRSKPGDNFSNLYCILVGKSGSGKDTPITYASEFAAQMARRYDIDDFLSTLAGEQASGAAIEDNLATSKEMIVVWDEIGKLFCRLLKAKSQGSVFEDQIAACLLRYYSAVRNPHVKLKAYSHTNKDRQERPKFVDYPFLSVLGSTTTGDLCDTMTPAAAKDGTVPRMLFLHPEKDRVQQYDFEELDRELWLEPAALKTIFQMCDTRRISQTGPAASEFSPATVKFSPDAVKMVKEALFWQTETIEAIASESLAACYARVVENALKVATAICYEHDSTGNWIITAPVMQWALSFAKANLATIESVLLQNSAKPQKPTRQQDLQSQIESILRLKDMSRSDILAACAVASNDSTFSRAMRYHIQQGAVKEYRKSVDGKSKKDIFYTWVR